MPMPLHIVRGVGVPMMTDDRPWCWWLKGVTESSGGKSVESRVQFGPAAHVSDDVRTS